MQSASFSKTLAGAFAALALCTSSTGAMAAATQTAHQASFNPLATLSILGSQASAAALCGSSAAAAVGAAAVSQGAATGCVLPAVDMAPPPVVETAPPPPYVEAPMAPVGGMGVSPLLLALVGIAAAVGLYYLLKGKDNFNLVFPVSPS